MNEKYEYELEHLETEDGTVTNNPETGKTAEEVYQEWLENKDKPVEPQLSETDLLMLAVAELDMQRAIDKTETQMAIAELASTVLGGMQK